MKRKGTLPKMTKGETEETDEEFWQRVDPYGDRFAERIPWWKAIIALAAVAVCIIGAALAWHHLPH
jgi:hypothetical protein